MPNVIFAPSYYRNIQDIIFVKAFALV